MVLKMTQNRIVPHRKHPYNYVWKVHYTLHIYYISFAIHLYYILYIFQILGFFYLA